MSDKPNETEAPAETAEESVKPKRGGPKGGGKPPCPPMGPEGDKTPAVVEWYFEHEPEKAEEKYGHRRGKVIEAAREKFAKR